MSQPVLDIEIRLFATLKDRAGQDKISLSIEEPANVATLLEAITEAYPALAASIPTTLVAVNRAFADLDTAIGPGDEVALFPPVSGGKAPHPTYFAVTPDPVEIDILHRHLAGPDIGAIVTFSGSVRGETQREGLPEATMHLEYEAYEAMAQVKLAQIAREIWQRWPLVKGIAIVQRIGKLAVGETTTIVACAAAHRDQGAFEAARYGIDRLKEIVPVWKKEVGKDQSIWVEGDYRPTTSDNA